MKHKAQNTVEIVALATLVVAVVFSVIMIYNNKNVELAKFSKIQTSAPIANEPGVTQYNPIEAETAGALSSILEISPSVIIEKSKSLTLSALSSVKSSDNKNIFEVANSLIDELNLDVDKFATSSLDEETVQDLADVAVEASAKLAGASSPTFDAYKGMLHSLLGS